MARRFVPALALAAIVSPPIGPASANESRPPLVAGWIEVVRINPGNLLVKAKLDTGARTSSIDAPDLVRFEKDEEPWVRFSFTTNDGKSITIERPVKRIAKIKDLTGPDQMRNVIEIGICLGPIYATTDVTLFDRTGFNYRLLLGRNFLTAAGVVVDSAKTHLTRAKCQEIVAP